LEVPFSKIEKKCELDIYCEIQSLKIGIELKYPQRKDKITVKNEDFNLKKHGNYGGIKYSYLKDIYRLEKLKNRGFIDKGFAVILTNDKSFHSDSNKKDRTEHLRLYENRNIKSREKISFKENKSPENFKEFKLNRSYNINWHCYNKENDFKFLIVEIK
jgi:hypothetical protein